MTDSATSIHRATPGKSILIICRDELSLDAMVKNAICRPWPAPVTMPTRYTLCCGGDTVTLILVCQVEAQAQGRVYDEIYTDGRVYFNERTMHLLRARLTDSRDWPGYFSKFP